MATTSQVKRWPFVVFGIIFLVFVGLSVQQHFFPHQATVFIGGQTFKVLVADTEALRFQGLSGRKNLGSFGGMLFTFSQADYYTFVMRDMLFPLDIVWINGSTVVDIKSDLPSEAGRSESDLTRYVSITPADAVLELPAGFTAAQGVKIGYRVRVAL